MKECPYTASSRDVSENTPPSALEISLVRGFCTPRPSRLPSGFALGQSLGPRGAKSPPLGNLLGLGGCIFRYIPPLGSVRIQYPNQLFDIKSLKCNFSNTILLIFPQDAMTISHGQRKSAVTIHFYFLMILPRYAAKLQPGQL